MHESTLVQSSRTLTVRAAARRLNVAPATIYRSVARGELAHVRIGRAIRIPAWALEPTEPKEHANGTRMFDLRATRCDR